MTERGRARAAVVATVLLVSAVQIGFVSHGSWSEWHSFTDYYDMLAEAFTRGQTHLLLEPKAELRQLADPYDPEANFPYRLHDALYYDGKYYLYWGPAPALVLAALKLVVPVHAGDELLTWLAMVGVTAACAWILWQVRAAGGAMPMWLVLTGTVLVGLTHPATMLLARAAIYEAAISWGQAFLLAGSAAALTWVRRPEGAGVGWLAAAGTCWALAFASRLSLLPAALVLTGWMAWRIDWRASGGRRQALGIGLPVVAGVTGLVLYNQARFGGWTDFGLRFQLLAADLDDTGLAAQFSALNVASNLVGYVVRPPELHGEAPFLQAVPGSSGEPMAGLLFAMPFLMLVVGGVRAIAAGRNGESPWSAGRWITGGLLGVAAAAGLPVILAGGGPQNRYLVDVAPALLLLAMIGAGQLWRRAGDRHRLMATAIGGLAAVSLLAGMALGSFWMDYTKPYRDMGRTAWYPP